MGSKERLSILAKKCFPQRYLLAVMSFTGIMIATNLRINMGIFGSVGKENPCNYTKLIQRKIFCKEENAIWDDKFEVYLKSSFYFGSLLTHLPGAYLSRKFGGKYTMGISVLGSNLFSIILIPASCYSNFAFYASMFMVGMAEGPMFSSLSELMSEWAPPSERTLLSAVTFGGIQVSDVVSLAIAIQILTVNAWGSIFYIQGIVGAVWFVIWMLVCYKKPSVHPFISTSELQYLTKNIPEADKTMPTPWKAILMSGPVWVLAIAQSGQIYALYSLYFGISSYYCSELHFNFLGIGAVSGIAYLAMWILSVLLGYTCDKIIELDLSNNSRTNLRRLMGSLAAVVPGTGMVCASYMDNEKGKIIIITIAVAFRAGFYCSIPANILDLSPNHAATITAILNTVADISGLITSYIYGIIITNHTSDDWRNIFWIMFAILMITNVPFALWASGNTQPWDKPNIDPNVSTKNLHLWTKTN